VTIPKCIGGAGIRRAIKRFLPPLRALRTFFIATNRALLRQHRTCTYAAAQAAGRRGKKKRRLARCDAKKALENKRMAPPTRRLRI